MVSGATCVKNLSSLTLKIYLRQASDESNLPFFPNEAEGQHTNTFCMITNNRFKYSEISRIVLNEYYCT